MKPTIYQGDCMDVLPTLEGSSVHCCVTSPPYWGLRDYGVPGRTWADGWTGPLGLEPTPELFVAHMVEVFREVRRVLRDDGTLWLNLGDSYGRGGRTENPNDSKRGHGSRHESVTAAGGYAQVSRLGSSDGIVGRGDRPGSRAGGVKEKDLVGIPWAVAFALREDGWYLRQDIIWHKPNPMPESVTDRCTKAHEYIFMLSKSERYYWNQEAILEPVSENTHARLSQDVEKQIGSERANGGAKTNGNMKAVGRKLAAAGSGTKNNESFNAACCLTVSERNKRSVWTVSTQPYKGAHFATFPKELIKPCILAGCPAGGTVLEPFLGSGTTAEVARKNGCHCIGIELNPEYHKLIKQRLSQQTIPLAD